MEEELPRQQISSNELMDFLGWRKVARIPLHAARAWLDHHPDGRVSRRADQIMQVNNGHIVVDTVPSGENRERVTALYRSDYAIWVVERERER
jgi:hypothetical protein